jgi:hypothetical protein
MTTSVRDQINQNANTKSAVTIATTKIATATVAIGETATATAVIDVTIVATTIDVTGKNAAVGAAMMTKRQIRKNETRKSAGVMMSRNLTRSRALRTANVHARLRKRRRRRRRSESSLDGICHLPCQVTLLGSLLF